VSGQQHGVGSEVGRLRTVILHRPGDELRRLTPRNNDELLFDGVPWVERAQAEHDGFAAQLRERDVEVLYLSDLLTETLDADGARAGLLDAALRPQDIGPTLAPALREHLEQLPSPALAHALMAGMAHGELPVTGGLMHAMTEAQEFIVKPLPNLLFTRDSSVWLAGGVAVGRLALPARRRESTITSAIYRHHPRFAGIDVLYGASDDDAWLEGGDVLCLAEGVLAVGVGQRTRPAGAESFAQRLFAAGAAQTVLAVPIAQDRATMHLDTICTMVDRDAVVMYPQVAHTLTAFTLTPDGRVDGPAPFLDAAASAMGIGRLRVIDTGLDPITAEREQWDDGNNTLALGPGCVVAYERNRETNERLREAGIEVVAISGSELGTGRGGPRCMSCPVWRDPLD
jgi:arginine deiminase